MKRIILFFTVCLGLSVSQTTFSANSTNARTVNKRSVANSITQTMNANRPAKRGEAVQAKSTRTATKTPNRTSNVTTRTNTTQSSKNTVTGRVATRAQTKNVSARQSVNKNVNTSRSGTNTVARKSVPLNETKMASIKSADYSQCKTVYYECMDEFCANKDANLRRCACSSRIHEFDSIKKQLNDAEDKMLDFNQRLLTVSLDKEDAAAINVASEGEIGYTTKDRSESEKLLNKITKTLNSGNSKTSSDLSPISLSLDMDTAWDDVDSLAGIATTSKNGLDLYNAARPICIEMAKEICSDDELKIAQDGYKLTIQQDCNTVAKSYDTLYNNTMEKIHESSALLDMSRLNNYQQRNSDDTLTCKKKILEQLSDTSVCGDNLHKCLDMTGEYIDPSTGKAFLSENLYNLVNLLREPNNGEKWSQIQQNSKFVSFLKSKKKFLEPAIKQCEDISDKIWQEFLEDALSQIKLAQNAKLEEIKRGCTTLVAECKKNASDDLSEFDSRALSIFNVAANKTANQMCNDVTNSCAAVMDVDIGNTWSGGMSGIATDISYNAIIETCSQIGRDCIIQKCNGTSGNFALCTNIISDNRMAILRRDACWDEVEQCVRSSDNLENMTDLTIVTDYVDYYNSLYPQSTPYHQCTDEDAPDCENVLPPTMCAHDDIACLIAEQIWGNCETTNNASAITTFGTEINGTIASNRILMPNTGSTILSWFATNTGTATNNASCNTYGCPINYTMNNGTCQLLTYTTTHDCGIATNRDQIIDVAADLTNFCESGVQDAFGNCCASGHKSNGVCVPEPSNGIPFNALNFMMTTCDTASACAGLDSTTTPTDTQCYADINYYCPTNASSRQIYIYCITPEQYVYQNSTTGEYICGDGSGTDGSFWLMVDQYGNYFDVDSTAATPVVKMLYRPQNSDYTNGSCPDGTLIDTANICTYQYDSNGGWSFNNTCNGTINAVPTDNEFTISYP